MRRPQSQTRDGLKLCRIYNTSLTAEATGKSIITLIKKCLPFTLLKSREPKIVPMHQETTIWKATLGLEKSIPCHFLALFHNEDRSSPGVPSSPILQWPRNTRNTPTPASWYRSHILISHHSCHSKCSARLLVPKSCWLASFCQLASTHCLFPKRKVKVCREEKQVLWNI